MGPHMGGVEAGRGVLGSWFPGFWLAVRKCFLKLTPSPGARWPSSATSTISLPSASLAAVSIASASRVRVPFLYEAVDHHIDRVLEVLLELQVG